MGDILNDKDLDTVFRAARSYNRWAAGGVSDVQIEAIYDLLRWGPTSANCAPARFVFCKSDEARARLAACVAANNREKVATSPLTVIIGQDMKFYDLLPRLFPHNPSARDWFANDPEVVASTALRNSSLQGAYLIIAARALGLDCGPMSGFNNAAVDREFFAGTDIKSNFICAIGKGTTELLFPRSPRLDFDEACQIL